MNNSVSVNINKGTRIRAQWLQPFPASLSGAQLKFAAKSFDVSGTVRHIRCASLEDQSSYVFFIDPDDESIFKEIEGVEIPRCTCGKPHLQILPKWVYWAENP
jgi:hypothetical protein